MQGFLHCIFEITLGVQNMHGMVMFYLNDNDVESNVHKKSVTREQKYPPKISPVESSQAYMSIHLTARLSICSSASIFGDYLRVP